MLHIKKFIEKVSAMESKQNKDLVMTMIDARNLRDDITKLLADFYTSSDKTKTEEVIRIEVKGGGFK